MAAAPISGTCLCARCDVAVEYTYHLAASVDYKHPRLAYQARPTNTFQNHTGACGAVQPYFQHVASHIDPVKARFYRLEPHSYISFAGAAALVPTSPITIRRWVVDAAMTLRTYHKRVACAAILDTAWL